MKQPDEPTEDKSDQMFGDDDVSGVWLWIATILAAMGIVGLVTLYASHLPLGDYATHQMTEP